MPDHLPLKLYDAHLHLFTDDVARYPFRGSHADRARIILNPNTAEKILELLETNNVEAASAVQYRKAYTTDNSYMLDSVSRFPQQFRAVVILDATVETAADQLTELANERNAVGLRLTGPIDASQRFVWLEGHAARTIEKAGQLGIFVELMYYPTETYPLALSNLVALARQHSGVRFLFDHFGFPAGSAQEDFGLIAGHHTLRGLRNVSFKLTTVNFDRMWRATAPLPDFVRRVVDLYGPDRIMWGSDYGNSLQPYAEHIRFATEATSKLTQHERWLVLRETGMSYHRRQQAVEATAPYSTEAVSS